MALMVDTPYKFDLNLIRKDVKWICEKYSNLQIGLTHTIAPLTPEEKITESIGSIYDRDIKKFKFRETDFTEFNEEFKPTYLFEIYKTIPDIGRFRIMNMDGPSAYTIHRDQTKRYHIAVETNSDCLFLFPALKESFHIPANGNVYLMDTRSRHTFLNGSSNMRTHLVLDDISTLK